MFGMGLRLHKRIISSWLIAILLLILPIFAHGEEIRVSQKASQKTAQVLIQSPDNPIAKTFTAKIILNPGNQAANAVGMTLSFPTDRLSVASVDTKNSFCTLFIYNTFDNKNGKIDLACGKPYPGTNKTSEIMTINFLAKTNGSARLELSDVQVLANDGFGTDILLSTSSKKIYIK